MNITLREPFSVSETETGMKNIDIIHPTHDSFDRKNRLYITCSGNSNKSFIAGNIVCEAIKTYFQSFLDSENDITVDFIEKAIRMAEISLSELKKENPETQLTTTLSLFYIATDCIYLCLLGESHVYQIRDNKIISEFIDHSDKKIRGVNEPIDINLILLKDIQANDQFFICNGNLSDISDESTICNVLSEHSTAEEKLSQIKKYYLNKYKKHFSGHLIPIYSVNKTMNFKEKVNSLIYSFI